MDILLAILAVIFTFIGLVGCIVPILPGPVLAYIGFLCCYFCSFDQISTNSVWVYLALTAAVTIADFILPAYLTKLAGGSKAGERGATAGLIVGMLLGSLVGAIIGPFIGAVVGEIIKDSSDLQRAFKVGLGSFLSFIVGTGFKLILCIILLVKVFSEVFPALANWLSNLF